MVHAPILKREWDAPAEQILEEMRKFRAYWVKYTYSNNDPRTMQPEEKIQYRMCKIFWFQALGIDACPDDDLLLRGDGRAGENVGDPR